MDNKTVSAANQGLIQRTLNHHPRKHNFSPGPGVLPEQVLAQVVEDIFSYGSSGIGVMELSHRSPEFEGIMASTEKLLRELLDIPKDFKVLFMTGGATNQFSCLPLNLCPEGSVANYLLSGFWSERASKEAEKFTSVHVAGTTQDIGYRSVPKNFTLSDNAAYLHFTTNNTIFGTQYHDYPTSSATLIGDASSDLLSKPIDLSQFGLVYAAAQKKRGDCRSHTGHYPRQAARAILREASLDDELQSSR